MEITVSSDLPKVSPQTIRNLYLIRPAAICMMDFGQWFCLGSGVKDDTLKNLEFIDGINYVGNADYDTVPHLVEKLSAFNAFQKV